MDSHKYECPADEPNCGAPLRPSCAAPANCLAGTDAWTMQAAKSGGLSSAAEWAIQTADGGIAVVMDELSGVGLMKLQGAGSGTASVVTPPDPTVAAPATAPADAAPATGNILVMATY